MPCGGHPLLLSPPLRARAQRVVTCQHGHTCQSFLASFRAQTTEENGKNTQEKRLCPPSARIQPQEDRENDNYMEENAVF